MEFIPTRLIEALLVLCGVLLLTTAFIWIKKFSPKNERELKDRMKSWWLIFIVIAAALLASPSYSIVVFAFISYLALKEFLSLVPTRKADRRVLFWAYLSIPFQFYLVSINWYGTFIIFIPVYMFLLLHIRMIIIGATKDFLRAVSTIHWGLMICVFSLSHLAYLRVLDIPEQLLPAGGAGLVLFLILATELNDVFQFISGKLFGRHKIVPTVSPNKTWEGFVGGFLLTILFVYVVAPLLTPVDGVRAAALGAIIAVAGFFGDTTISAVKRDLNVKDSGNLLPGHGGILDRLDSLCFTTLIFFHFVHYFYV